MTTNAHALLFYKAILKVPSQCDVKSNLPIKITKTAPGLFRVNVSKNEHFPIEINIEDPFGITITQMIHSPQQLQGFYLEDKIITQKEANPIQLLAMPKLCPRVVVAQEGSEQKVIYEAATDILNHRPGGYLFDPDYKTNKNQKKLSQQFDDKNVLQITRVKILYDYEDNTILDYKGPHPLTGKEQLIYEGEGGFYANFHYAIVPFDKRYLDLGRQELLNLAQGKLAYIDREDLTPLFRTHSFIPGPYLSKTGVYALCEWGDTAFQAKEQELYYHDLIVWDWDMADREGVSFEKLLLIVWEGDEEDWLIADGLLDPLYLTDDIVGVFPLSRDELKNKITLKNEKGVFEIDLQTKN